VEARAFAGCFAPRGPGPVRGAAALEAALRREGPGAGAELGPLAAAWTPPAPLPRGGKLCLVDGRLRTGALAAELGLDPASASDELLTAGWERLGDALLERLDGEFALLLWDPERMSGLLARDRLGARPLFLAEAGGALLFASEVRILLAALPTAPAPDPLAVAYWLARTSSGDPRTLHAGIERLPAAHAVRLDRDGWQRRRWWRPRYAPPRRLDAAEAAAEVRACLRRAVERSLAGSTSAAVMLSGGLDSATVAASAPQPLPAYSALFPGDPAVDEAAGVERVRGFLGMPGVEGHFRGGSALTAAAEFTHEWELPSVSPNLFLWLPLLRRAAADGVDVLLDGEGGDELFGCARYLVADRLRAGRLPAAVRTARRLPGMGERPRARWIGRALRSYGVRAGLPPALHERLRRARGAGAAGPAWLAEGTERLHRRGHDPWLWKRMAGPRWWAELAHALTAAGDAMGAPDQLRREGRMAGLELRHPLRDPELVDLVLSLPPELGFDPHLDRPLVRRALAGALPAETLRADRKPAFDSLLRGAFEGADGRALSELLARPHPELARRVSAVALTRLRELPPRERPRGWTLDMWRLATLELWLRHREDPGRAPLPAGPAASLEFVEHPALVRQLRKRG
jgi:asparagine synthase (glutamine-hydrolysing)